VTLAGRRVDDALALETLVARLGGDQAVPLAYVRGHEHQETVVDP